ncbi:MAG: hypothetical protein V1697_01720 [Candidatus Levyibacteriota bacterium]
MKHKDIYILLIPSFVLVVFWIIFTIYHNSVSSTITPTQSVQIKPISPDFDMTTIQALKKRGQVVPLFEMTGSQESEKSASPQATLTPTPTTTPAPQGGLL